MCAAFVFLVRNFLEPGNATPEADGDLAERFVRRGAVPVLHVRCGVIALAPTHFPEGLTISVLLAKPFYHRPSIFIRSTICPRWYAS